MPGARLLLGCIDFLLSRYKRTRGASPPCRFSVNGWNEGLNRAFSSVNFAYIIRSVEFFREVLSQNFGKIYLSGLMKSSSAINCVIIDDDLVAKNTLEHFVKSTDGLTLLNSFTDPIDGANFLRKNINDIGLLFLDVEMPAITGIELLESFEQTPPVILVTSKEEYAVKAFEHRVLHYLVKPVDYGRFLKAIEKLLKDGHAPIDDELDFIFVKDNGILRKVHHKSIFYIEALGDYVKVYTREKVYVVNSTMSNIEGKLSSKKEFIRVHRSFIINLEHLDNFDAESCYVHDRIIPIGNKYKTGLQSRLNII